MKLQPSGAPPAPYAMQSQFTHARNRASEGIWVIYRWMTLGLATTGAVAALVAHSHLAMSVLLGTPWLFYGLMFAQLGLVIGMSAVARRVSTPVAASLFFLYAALTGVTFSTLFLIYTTASIAATFFITAGAFGGLSAVGLFTSRDLSGFGRFAIFALIGVLIASVVNIFLHNGMLDWAITVGGVLVFAGLTAYNTQRLRDLLSKGDANANLPLVGALTLYLDFINMFLFLLRIFGGRQRS